MSSVGRDIENAIQSMLAISEKYAALKAELDNATNDLSILETLFSVSKYIGSDPETHVVLSVLEDSVKGVFGAGECHVIFSPQRQHLSNSVNLYEYLNYQDLKEAVDDVLYIEDVKVNDITTLDNGALLLIKLSVGEELYGFLAIHWTFNYELSNSSLVFLRIISNQVSMYLKSAKLVEEFKQLAILDPLTGIYNRSYFSNIESTTSPQIGESIIMFDLDKFKNINDTFGHQYGDKILKQFATLLQEHADNNDAVAFKYGGEEFVIKSSGGQDNAFKIAEEVRIAFEDETSYTVSAGISTCGTSCNVSNYKLLLELADESLYISKKSGRNKTTISNPDLQLSKKSSKAISRIVSKVFRDTDEHSIFRLSPVEAPLITEEEYARVKQIVTGVTRMYDDVYFTPSLDILIFVNGQISEKKFRSRIKNLVKEELPFIKYKIFSLNQLFDDIIRQSKRMTDFVQLFANFIDLDVNEKNQLILVCEWHDIGKIFVNPMHHDTGDQNIKELHSWLSYNIAQEQPLLSEFSSWFLNHHESLSSINKDNINKEDLPFSVQLIDLVEVFGTLTEDHFLEDSTLLKGASKKLKSLKGCYDQELLEQFNTFILKQLDLA